MDEVEQDARGRLQPLTDEGIVTELRLGAGGYGGQLTSVLNVYVECAPDRLPQVKQDILARLADLNAEVAVIDRETDPE